MLQSSLRALRTASVLITSGVGVAALAGDASSALLARQFVAPTLAFSPQDKATSAPAKDAKPAAKSGAQADKPAAKSAASDKPADGKAAAKPQKAESKESSSEMKLTGDPESHDYREVSSFYNIREANANLEKGEWEFETTFEWSTTSHEHDEVIFEPSIKYGFTNNFWVELNVPLKLGEGGEQGNGDLGLELFYQFLHESESMPAMATWAAMRIPSGEGSSGVDASFHLVATKHVATKCRAHIEGFVETANGYRGGDEDEDRRNFQWGVGPGFDYQVDDKTIAIVNYLNRSSEEFGHHNQNILELGVAREIAEGQHIKAALDIGLDGADETPNLAVKLQWSIEWK